MKINNLLLIALQNIKISYSNTLLGFLWLPLSFLILIFVKSYLFSDILDLRIGKYVPHLVTGLLFWTFLSNNIIKNLNLFFNNKIILNMNINPFDFLKISHLESIFNITLNSLMLYFFFIFLKIQINIFYLFIASFILSIFLYELNKVISIIFLISRDLVFLISSSLILIFFLTPIIWEPSMLSEQNLFYLQFNPFYHLVEVFRFIIYANFTWNIHFKVTISIYFAIKFINLLVTDKIISRINLYS
jgi:ABC-type polysaccharide/polyol phosphate export permease